MKQEVEVALRLLEKDIHEKQDLIVSLRKQLDDVKSINLEMYNRLQVNKISHLSKLLTGLPIRFFFSFGL